MEIDLGGATCILQHVGGDHAMDSIVVYYQEEKILFLADSIYPDIYTPKRTYRADRVLELLEAIDQFDAETYILSHWKPISRAEYIEEAKLLKTLALMTKEQKGSFEDIKRAYQATLTREMNEDELETIHQFVNGYNE